MCKNPHLSYMFCFKLAEQNHMVTSCNILDAGDDVWCPAKVAHYSEPRDWGYTSAETSVVALPKHLSHTHKCQTRRGVFPIHNGRLYIWFLKQKDVLYGRIFVSRELLLHLSDLVSPEGTFLSLCCPRFFWFSAIQPISTLLPTHIFKHLIKYYISFFLPLKKVLLVAIR